jgi:uncharacterized membrane protein YcaP (DUF421 family)
MLLIIPKTFADRAIPSFRSLQVTATLSSNSIGAVNMTVKSIKFREFIEGFPVVLGKLPSNNHLTN